MRVEGQKTEVKTPAEILKENEPSLALILSGDGDTVSLGSGFFIGDGSAVVTNFHVVQGAKQVVIKTGSGKILYADSVYAFDEKKDLAILKVASSGIRGLALGDSDKVPVGSSVVVIGNPEGLEKSVTNGLISGVRTFESQKLFQISAPVSHGSSGAPVFDERGQVVGVVVAFLSDGQNLNFAIPVNQAAQLWINRREASLTALPAAPVEAARPTIDLEGGWSATFADSISSGQLSFTLTQDTDMIKGTYTSSMGGGGTINGRIENRKFEFTLSQSMKDCPGTYVGTADLRQNAMVGSFTGADCQGSHANGTFSMARGSVPMTPPTTATPSVANASSSQPIIQYGTPNELKNVHTVFIYGVDPDVRNNMVKQFSKHLGVQVVGEIEHADIVLVFGAQVFSMGSHTSVWTDSNGNGWASTNPRYGINGQGSAVRFIPPNTLRVVWQFSATRVSAFQRRPSTNFVRDFMSAWEKANH
jgi:hypothetical protein